MPSEVLKSWNTSLRQGLRALEERNQLRTLAEIHGVNLCSNDYLGLAVHPALKQAVGDAMQNASRVGGTGSRLLSGHSDTWRELEEEFAKFAGTESALFFTTGYAANLGLIPAMLGKDDIVFSDALNHASLIDGIRLSGARKIIYPHLDLSVLEESLRQESRSAGRKIIVTESVFSMDGDIAPLNKILGLAENYGAALIVDEAHATAVHGPGGGGIAAQEGIVPQLLAVIHTCGKALGCAGAFVCGPALLQEHLINHARTFIFSTALPPYFAEQIRAALRIAQSGDGLREKLHKLSAQLIQDLGNAGFDTSGSATQIVPVVIGGNQESLDAAEHLQREGFAVRAIRPPTVPVGKSRLRLSLTSNIPQAELTRLVQSLIAWRARQQNAMAAVKRA
jgi:8-amino-7-oxononanoate synthase